MTAPAPAVPIQVVIVEDFESRQAQLLRILQRDGDIIVAGNAMTGSQAIRLVAESGPDVVIVDLQLADGSGRRVIEQIMAQTPTPILVLSASIDGRTSPSAVDALVAGALDALPLPDRWTTERAAELRHRVRQIRKVPVIRHPRGGRDTQARRSGTLRGGHQPVVALAASTGGPSALATVLSRLGGLAAPVLIVQHLHPEFTAGLVEWMARASALPVELAQHGQFPHAGHVYFAPGGLHLKLGTDGRLELDATPRTAHRPSADQLFHSVAEIAGPSAVGVVLTGMGEDGARGLLAIHDRGGSTLAQNEATSAVFGMPRAAQRLGAVKDLLPLDQLAEAMIWSVQKVTV